MNDQSHQDLLFLHDDEENPSYRVSITHHAKANLLTVNDIPVDDQTMAAAILARVVEIDGKYTIFGLSSTFTLTLFDPIQSASNDDHADSSLASPMPGKITSITVSEGQTVKKGDVLVVVEAMKMEHAITAPRDGTIDHVSCTVGEQVDEGRELLGLTEE
jgi:acetyl/propionyl-CoA carboxylase alpha subunit